LQMVHRRSVVPARAQPQRGGTGPDWASVRLFGHAPAVEPERLGLAVPHAHHVLPLVLRQGRAIERLIGPIRAAVARIERDPPVHVHA